MATVGVVVVVVVVVVAVVGRGRGGGDDAEVDGGGEVRVATTGVRAEEEEERRRLARLGVGGLRKNSEGVVFCFNCELLLGFLRPLLERFSVSRSLRAGPGRREQSQAIQQERGKRHCSFSLTTTPLEKGKRKISLSLSFYSHPARPSRRFSGSNLLSAAANGHDPVSTRESRPRAGAEGVGLRPNEHRPQRKRARGGEPLGSERRASKKGRKSAQRKNHHPPFPYLLARLGANAVLPDVEATSIPRMVSSGTIVEPGGAGSRRGGAGKKSFFWKNRGSFASRKRRKADK